jgi:alanyl-tRNA synthetase
MNESNHESKKITWTQILRTLETGIKLLDKVVNEAKADGRKEVSGTEAFVLYDTYGFPLDLTELILKEHGFTVNRAVWPKMRQTKKRKLPKLPLRKARKSLPRNLLLTLTAT